MWKSRFGWLSGRPFTQFFPCRRHAARVKVLKKIAIQPDPNSPCEKTGYCIAQTKKMPSWCLMSRMGLCSIHLAPNHWFFMIKVMKLTLIKSLLDRLNRKQSDQERRGTSWTWGYKTSIPLKECCVFYQSPEFDPKLTVIYWQNWTSAKTVVIPT